VPDTHYVWEGVLAHLSRVDARTLSLPGFAVDLPDGLGSTKEEYVDWLIGELEAVDEPVDIVGHDWGALLTERVVCLRPDLIRTWAAGGGALHEAYEWHAVAKMWQTPGQGEQVMEAMTPDTVAQVYIAEVRPEDMARQFAARVDDRMKAAILPLYRSAANVWLEWSPAMDSVEPPGLVIWGEDDPYGPIGLAQRMSERAGAGFLGLEKTSQLVARSAPEGDSGGAGSVLGGAVAGP
jgi:pimeloyl-ACP methyl ester carboxylesterase